MNINVINQLIPQAYIYLLIPISFIKKIIMIAFKNKEKLNLNEL